MLITPCRAARGPSRDADQGRAASQEWKWPEGSRGYLACQTAMPSRSIAETSIQALAYSVRA